MKVSKKIKGKEVGYYIESTTPNQELIKKLKNLSMKFCVESNHYFHKGKWLKYSDSDKAIAKVVKSKLGKTKASITPMEELKFKPGLRQDIEVEIKFSDEELYAVPLRIDFTTCPKVSKKGTQYFEGILQLRNQNDHVIEFIRQEVNKVKDKGIFINQEKSVRNGIDFYLTSQKYVQLLGNKLLTAFGGKLKTSAKIFGRDQLRSKDLFRVSVLFECLNFVPNDVIKSGNKIIHISKISKLVFGTDLRLDKKVAFDYKNKEIEILEKKKTSVVKIYPHIEILDPETYQPVKVENKKTVKQGQNVVVVAVKGKYYIVK